ncbi:DEAD/DEAH box helicase [Pelotomaculum propionicicum]|uniref:DEAD/DEAH box helicase n=1 Tax=Pelotomaculum propionicicum TaxID=258475 RepID=UPI003B7A2F76
MATPKTKQARERLLSILRGQEPLPLDVIYPECDCDYDSVAGALSSLIEKEEIRIGRLKTRAGWLIANRSVQPLNGAATWHSSRGEMRVALPKVLKALRKKYGQAKSPGCGSDICDEKLKIITGLLSDGKARTRDEIIAATGLEDIRHQVWRSLSQLPDGSYTVPDSKGAWESLWCYIGEKPRRHADLLRLYKGHREITARLTSGIDQEPFIRLPRGLITTSASEEGRKESAKRERLNACRDTMDSMPHPFFIPAQLGLGNDEFAYLSDSLALRAEFEGKEYYCLRREFPGEVLVEQLGDIAGRYFAPPHTVSAPVFLKEHSLGENEAAGALGLDRDALSALADAGELDCFTLDERKRFWRSDIEDLKRDRDKLRNIAREHEKLRKSEAAAVLGITPGQVDRLVEEGRLAPVPYQNNNRHGKLNLFRRSDLEKLRESISVIISGWGADKGTARDQDHDFGEVSRAKKSPPRRKEISPPPPDKLTLDDFQIEASEALREGLSVLVSAPTGNGKTLVAEMLAKDVMSQGMGMVYTSPLKALSNQKYRDFKELFGDDAVGLVTGDISINPGAPMLIMTTEIFRNWCLSEPEQLEKTSYVVFDEIHYLDDAERGTTWEESILFAPPHVRILGLSATVPNVDEMADWISSVRGGNVVVILEKRRIVPLAVRWLLPGGRIVSEREARGEIVDLVEDFKTSRGRRHWNDTEKVELPELSCSEITGLIQDKLPALFFVFSRGRTEILAHELGHDWDFLNYKEKRIVGKQIRDAEAEHPGTFSGPGWRKLRRLLYQGIGYHHAGLLPPVKYLVEKLYSNRMLWVVFCTETFAAGVNFPAASAVFDSTRKWDGHDFRILQNREFFQIAGRAGRRGFDQVGHVFIRIDSRFPEQTGFFQEKEVEPVTGRLTISPNTVLSLLRYKTDDEIKHFLNGNFKMHQLKKRKDSLELEIKIVSERVSELSVCPDSQTLACPLERVKARRQLKRFRWKGRNKEKDLLQKKLSSFAPKKCRDTEKCRVTSENLKQSQNYLQLLKQEYKVVSENAKSIFIEYKEVRSLLEELGYMKEREFYPRGLFALELHVQEILVTELVFSGLIEEAEPAEVAAVMAGVEYIPGKNTHVARLDLPALHETSLIRRDLLRMGVPERFCIWSGVPGSLAYAWYNGASFNELLEMSSLQPGDIFSVFRREIDLLRQIERAAAGNPALIERVRAVRSRLDRDEVALSF